MSRYSYVLQAATETPWAIRPERLEQITELLNIRLAGGRFTDAEIEARIGAVGNPQVGNTRVQQGSVSVIPVGGVIMPKASVMNQMSGGTSLDQLQADIQAALQDPSVDSILLNIDSPGGSVAMLPETAAMIRQARTQKPVHAIANTDALSAAYWIASQADQLYVTPSGTVGAVGVYSIHQDQTGALEKAGIKPTIIKAGPFKAEDHPAAGPLTEEAKATIQNRVDQYYGMFVQGVATGRGISTGQVQESFGGGRIVLASDALAAGMVDGIMTLGEAVQHLSTGAAASSANSAAFFRAETTAPITITGGGSFIEQAESARVAASDLLNRARSLAEVRRDNRLTQVKRDALVGVADDLQATAAELSQLLTETTKPDATAELLREAARFEARRANPNGG